MNIRLFALIVLVSLASFAEDNYGRVTIYPFQKQNVPVSYVLEKENPVFHTDGNWAKDPAVRKATLMLQNNTKALNTEEWTPFRATFRAGGTGTVEIHFHARYYEDVEKRGWALVRHIKINGVKMNYDFKDTYFDKVRRKKIPRGFWLVGKSLLQEDAGDGKPAILVNHDNRFAMKLNVVEGETYTIEAEFQGSFAPLF